MKEFIEKLIGRLEEEIDIIKDEVYRDYEERIIEECAIENVIDIVNELAEEYINTSTDTSTTNADRIRSMTDEELAELFYSTDHNVDEWNCIVKLGNVRLQDNKADILAWLQSEVEGVTENE